MMLMMMVLKQIYRHIAPLRWRYSHSFKVADTSVPPKSAYPEFPKGYADLLMADITMKPSATWAEWDRWVVDERTDGWAYGRIAIRQGDAVEWVYGHLAGNFGIWSREFATTDVDEEGDVSRGKAVFAFLTHLRSGNALGLFADRRIAMAAAEIAERLPVDWPAIATRSDNVWVPSCLMTVRAWSGMGFQPSVNVLAWEQTHAAPPAAVWERTQAAMDIGKPEKLS
jgi:hypothetical protein